MRLALATPWRKYVQVQKVGTELYGIDADAAVGARLKFVVFPGNPGNARYYERFMQSLHEKFAGSADIVAISHLGHDPDTPHKGQVWDLQQQIQHKADFLREHVLDQGSNPVVVLAHSIGAYMAAHALARLDRGASGKRTPQDGDLPDRLIQVVGLFPFLAVDPECRRQRLLKTLAARSGVMGGIAGGLSVLPFFLKSAVVGLFSPDLEPHAVHTTVHLLTASSIQNNFHLAHHEFQELDAAIEWPLLQRMGRRLTLVACPNDIWLPERHYKEAGQQLPDAQLLWREDLSHAFCVSSRECDAVAGMVHAMVQPLLLEYEAAAPPPQAASPVPARATPRL